MELGSDSANISSYAAIQATIGGSVCYCFRDRTTDDGRRANTERHRTRRRTHSEDEGNSFGKVLAWVAGAIAVWYSIQLFRSFFSESGAELIVDVWLLGHYVVSYLLLKRLSGSEPVDGTIQWLARLWIVPTIGMLALFIWGLSGGGLGDAIRLAASQSLLGVLFDFVGFVFLLVSVPALWLLSRVQERRPINIETTPSL